MRNPRLNATTLNISISSFHILSLIPFSNSRCFAVSILNPLQSSRCAIDHDRTASPPKITEQEKPPKMGFLDYRFKLPVHIVEFILIVGVCAISTARLFLPGVTTKTRANTIALGFVSRTQQVILGGLTKKITNSCLLFTVREIHKLSPLPAPDRPYPAPPAVEEPQGLHDPQRP